MKTLTTLVSGLALAFVLAAPLHAQDDVLRRWFPYLGNQLTVEVVADAPGKVQLVRGQPGQIEVAARAERGFPGASLAQAGSDRLLLTAMGAERAEYLVTVPENAFVRVKLPDRELTEVFGTQHTTVSYDWRVANVPGNGGAAAAEAPAAAGRNGLVVTFTGDSPPNRLSIPQSPAVRAVTVRWEGDRFLVAADRPLVLEPGDPENLEIRVAGQPLQLVIVLPRRTNDFVLQLGNDPVLALAAGHARVLCEPVTEQALGDDRRWFTFDPQGPRSCTGRPLRAGTRP